MKKLILSSLLVAAGVALTSQPAHALRDLSLKQQADLPRGQYFDLVDPDHVYIDRLVVKFVEDTRVRLRGDKLVSLEGRALGAVDGFLQAHPEIKVDRLIQSMDEDKLDEYVARGERMSGYDLADMNNYYLLTVDGNGNPQKLLAELLQIDLVQTCYYEPISEPATCGTDISPATPNWEANQDYREAAPTGVDIDYAWNFHADANGVSTYWWQDLEWGWCEDHEDFPTNFTVYTLPDSTDPDFFNHGTSVVGIVSACDDGKGVTGLTPDCRPTARQVTDYASTADALAAIGSSLLTGETYLIEMHAQGPDPGWTCVCNCGQFRYVAMEYWQANFDAVLVNSGNGKFCVEAAGNGSMDLDWAGYGGAFNLGTRDSQAIMVGAGSSGSVHNPMCWTNHGSRISAYGWGENVYSTGYGGLWGQTDCQQDYTASFSGTSSASPIVTGTVISLALVHKALDANGDYPSPLTLRSRLQTNGTPQGPTDTWKEIAKLPNMKGIFAPDMAPYTPGGWTAQIVPSNVTGTTTVPANLPPAPATTYLDYAWVNWSHYATIASSPVRVYRDDVWFVGSTGTDHGPYSFKYTGDFGTTVRGGLHYLKLIADPLFVVDESVEDNNTYVAPYRWDPIPLVANVPQSFTRAPKKNPEGYSVNARDGFGNGGNFGGWWDVFAATPSGDGTGDLDVYLYNTAPTSTSGWTTTVATSGYVSNVDFVGCNNNQVSDGDYASVLNYNDSDNGYVVEGDGSTGLGSVPAGQLDAGDFSLAAGEIIDAFEFYAPAAGDVWFNFDVTAGNADIAVFFYDAATTYFARGTADLTLNAGGPGEDESGVYTVAAPGWIGIVVCKNLRTELNEYADFSLYWGTPSGDITSTTLSGWDLPLVARNSGVGTQGILPAVLNEGVSVLDHGFHNIGAGPFASGSNDGFILDGPMVYESGNFGVNILPGGTGIISNRSIGTVKGGRHLVGAELDVNGEVAEELPNGELNNGHYDQFAWAPYALAGNTPLVRTPAPNWSVTASPSYLHEGFQQDGYSLTPSFWSAAAAIPHLASEQLNVHGYDYHSTDIAGAFVGPVSSSYNATGEIAFVMVNGNVVAGQRDVGVTNNWGYPGVVPTGNYTVEGAQRLVDLYPGSLTTGSIPAASIVRTYDANLVAGEDVLVTLDNQSGVDLGIAVFDAGLDYAAMSDAALYLDAFGAGADESATFSPTVSGWHGVVVFRHGTADLGVNANYRVILGTRKPATITSLDLIPVELDASDNNYHFTLDCADVTQDIYGNPLVVDQYRFWWGFDPYGAFPAAWNNWVTSPASQVVNFASTTGGTTGIYFLVTAVDSDGMLVASSQPELTKDWTPAMDAPLSTLLPGQRPEAATQKETKVEVDAK